MECNLDKANYSYDYTNKLATPMMHHKQSRLNPNLHQSRTETTSESASSPRISTSPRRRDRAAPASCPAGRAAPESPSSSPWPLPTISFAVHTPTSPKTIKMRTFPTEIAEFSEPNRSKKDTTRAQRYLAFFSHQKTFKI